MTVWQWSDESSGCPLKRNMWNELFVVVVGSSCGYRLWWEVDDLDNKSWEMKKSSNKLEECVGVTANFARSCFNTTRE